MALSWDEPSGRFRDPKSGQFVSEARVRSAVDGVADAASDRMAAASARLLSGELSLGAWQTEMQATIKLAHSGTAVIAHGGAEQMTFSRWGSVGQTIRGEYGYLRQFAADIASGAQPLNGSLTSRARQYGQAARVTFERTYSRGQQQRGYRAERNILHPAEHCAACQSETARGWVPIGSLIPIGQRTCRGNDRCSISYRREPASAEAAA
jgi:hypothetical protein